MRDFQLSQIVAGLRRAGGAAGAGGELAGPSVASPGGEARAAGVHAEQGPGGGARQVTSHTSGLTSALCQVVQECGGGGQQGRGAGQIQTQQAERGARAQARAGELS